MTASAPAMAGRIALVTGASRGIGAAVARRFAAEGAHVLAVARGVGGLEALDDAIKADAARETRGSGGVGPDSVGGVTLVPFDLAKLDAIDEMAAAIHERFGRLDVLVGNAARLGVLTPVSQMEPKVWRDVLDLNLTANWWLLRAFDPLLNRSESGRAIFVTANVAREPKAFWGAYAVSKAGLETMVSLYAAEVRRSAIRVNLIDPGVARTHLRAEAYPGEDPQSVPLPETVTDEFVRLAQPSCDSHGTVVQVTR